MAGTAEPPTHAFLLTGVRQFASGVLIEEYERIR